jgi:hypothetical protein
MKRLALLGLIVLSGCAAAPSPPVLDATAAFGETAAIDGIRVRPLSLIEDSRCPAEVTCVWAGRLVIHAEMSGGNWRLVRELTLGQPIPIADGELTLASAVPAKRKPVPIEPRDYRFTFIFDGGL